MFCSLTLSQKKMTKLILKNVINSSGKLDQGNRGNWPSRSLHDHWTWGTRNSQDHGRLQGRTSLLFLKDFYFMMTLYLLLLRVPMTSLYPPRSLIQCSVISSKFSLDLTFIWLLIFSIGRPQVPAWRGPWTQPRPDHGVQRGLRLGLQGAPAGLDRRVRAGGQG